MKYEIVAINEFLDGPIILDIRVSYENISMRTSIHTDKEGLRNLLKCRDQMRVIVAIEKPKGEL